MYIILAISTQVHHCIRHRDTPLTASKCGCCTRCCRLLVLNVSQFEQRWQRYTANGVRLDAANLGDGNPTQVMSQSRDDGNKRGGGTSIPVELAVSRSDRHMKNATANNGKSNNTSTDERRRQRIHQQLYEQRQTQLAHIHGEHGNKHNHDDSEAGAQNTAIIDMPSSATTATAIAFENNVSMIPSTQLTTAPPSDSSPVKKLHISPFNENEHVLSPRKTLTPTSNLKSVHTSTGSHSQKSSNSQLHRSPNKKPTLAEDDNIPRLDMQSQRTHHIDDHDDGDDYDDNGVFGVGAPAVAVTVDAAARAVQEVSTTQSQPTRDEFFDRPPAPESHNSTAAAESNAVSVALPQRSFPFHPNNGGNHEAQQQQQQLQHNSLMMPNIHAHTPTASNNDGSLQPIHEDQSVRMHGFVMFDRYDDRRQSLSLSPNEVNERKPLKEEQEQEQEQQEHEREDTDSLRDSTTKLSSPTGTAEFITMPASKASLTTIASTQSYEYSSDSRSARDKTNVRRGRVSSRARYEEPSESSLPEASPTDQQNLPYPLQDQESDGIVARQESDVTDTSHRLSLGTSHTQPSGSPLMRQNGTASTETSVWTSRRGTQTPSIPASTPQRQSQTQMHSLTLKEAPVKEEEQPGKQPQATTAVHIDGNDENNNTNNNNMSADKLASAVMHHLESDMSALSTSLVSPTQQQRQMSQSQQQQLPFEVDGDVELTGKPHTSFVSHSSNASLNFSNAYETLSPTFHHHHQHQRQGSHSNTNVISNVQLPPRNDSMYYSVTDTQYSETPRYTNNKKQSSSKSSSRRAKQKMVVNWDTTATNLNKGKAKDERRFVFASAVAPDEAIGDATYYHMVDLLNAHSRSRSKTDIRNRKTSDFPPQVNTQQQLYSLTELEHATPRPEVSPAHKHAPMTAAAAAPLPLPPPATTTTTARKHTVDEDQSTVSVISNVNASSDLSQSPSPAPGPGGAFQSLPVAQTDLAVYLRVHQALLDSLRQQLPPSQQHNNHDTRAALLPNHKLNSRAAVRAEEEPQVGRMGTIPSQMSTFTFNSDPNRSHGSLPPLNDAQSLSMSAGVVQQSVMVLEARKESSTEMAFNMTFMVCSPMLLMEVWDIFHCTPYKGGDTLFRSKTNSECHHDFWYFFALFLIVLWYAFVATLIYRSRRFIRSTFDVAPDHLQHVYRRAFGDKCEFFWINNVKLTRWWYGYVPQLLQSLVVCICVLVPDINVCLETLTLLLLFEFFCMRVARPFLSASDRLCQFLLRTFVLLESSILIFCLPYSSGYNIAIGCVGLFWIFMTQIEVCSGLYPLHPNSTVCASCFCCCGLHDNVDDEDSDYELFDEEQVTPRQEAAITLEVAYDEDDDDDDQEDASKLNLTRKNSLTSQQFSPKQPPQHAPNTHMMTATTTKHGADSITPWNVNTSERSVDSPAAGFQKRNVDMPPLMGGSELASSQRRQSGQLDEHFEPPALQSTTTTTTTTVVHPHMKYLKEQMSTATQSEEFLSTSKPTSLKESKEEEHTEHFSAAMDKESREPLYLTGIDETHAQKHEVDDIDDSKQHIRSFDSFQSVPSASDNVKRRQKHNNAQPRLKQQQKARAVSESSQYESTVSVNSYDSQTKSITNSRL
eukprot:CAMPEP_0202734334 /NCGR_PEP_ID=MMETSP1385-20130828/188624_1 /ASSEMBLY_ACC=CAM_ASM_000861 /TAXON_ID=933848 /ORGANISM="Elphidium margaritaceum" /LENGTH=1612 /DNA_ID=CAMNT_0049400693 /DNA_START=328 /DNA_END=5169 /DNA_ORIENTATION=-